MNISMKKMQCQIFFQVTLQTCHFLKKREIRDIMILIIIMEVMGKYILKLGLLITISPGSLPIGNFPSHGQNSPTARNITPSMISVFCIVVVLPLKKKLPLGQFLQQPFDHIAVGALAEMLHYRPHGLHGTFKFCKINIFINPGQHFFPACHSGQV